jgi:hypothetical protein
VDALLGRKAIVNDLTALMLEGRNVLLYGPMGIGKTAILEAVRRTVEKKGLPCGLSVQTRSLSDLTNALLRAYPDAIDNGMTQRQIRSDLRRAIVNNPGVLFLDHIHDPGTQFKGYLRLLRESGLGMLIAADVDAPRDHAHFRAMHLAWREMAVHPLLNLYIYRMLAYMLSGKSLPNSLKSSDSIGLVRMAQGRPGWICMISDLLEQTDYWSNGNVLLANIRISIMSEIARRYFVLTGDCSYAEK